MFYSVNQLIWMGVTILRLIGKASVKKSLHFHLLVSVSYDSPRSGPALVFISALLISGFCLLWCAFGVAAQLARALISRFEKLDQGVWTPLKINVNLYACSQEVIFLSTESKSSSQILLHLLHSLFFDVICT